jgi:hypothetical protein
MKEKLETMLKPRKLKMIIEKDIELNGIKELYNKPISFLGVEPFFIDYGFFSKKTYLVLPHFNEKFKLIGTEYSNDTLIIKIIGDQKEKIEPTDYVHYNSDGSYDLPSFITVRTLNGYLHLCLSRFENSRYIEIKKNTKKIKAVFEKQTAYL